MAFAWAKLLHRACCADRPEWHDTSAFRSLALMDDSVVIEPDLGLRPQLSVDALEEAIRQTLGPLAISGGWNSTRRPAPAGFHHLIKVEPRAPIPPLRCRTEKRPFEGGTSPPMGDLQRTITHS